MRRILAFFGLRQPLPGLEDILAQVAEGQLTQDEAAQQIREIASMAHIPPWIPRLLRLIGVMSILVGVGLAGYSISFSIDAKETEGTVIEMVGDEMKSPIVRYNVDGKPFTFQSSMSSSPPRYVVGERVSILYRANDPTQAQIDSFTDRWLFPVAFTSSGIMVIVFSFFLPRIINAITGEKKAMRRERQTMSVLEP